MKDLKYLKHFENYSREDFIDNNGNNNYKNIKQDLKLYINGKLVSIWERLSDLIKVGLIENYFKLSEDDIDISDISSDIENFVCYERDSSALDMVLDYSKTNIDIKIDGDDENGDMITFEYSKKVKK